MQWRAIKKTCHKRSSRKVFQKGLPKRSSKKVFQKGLPKGLPCGSQNDSQNIKISGLNFIFFPITGKRS
jgi:hypothetical protein